MARYNSQGVGAAQQQQQGSSGSAAAGGNGGDSMNGHGRSSSKNGASGGQTSSTNGAKAGPSNATPTTTTIAEISPIGNENHKIDINEYSSLIIYLIIFYKTSNT